MARKQKKATKRKEKILIFFFQGKYRVGHTSGYLASLQSPETNEIILTGKNRKEARKN